MIPLALACIAIAGGADRITAGDLGLQGVDAAAVVGLAPAPGVQRVFRVAELQRIAARLQATAAPESDVCVERRTVVLDAARLMEAMQKQSPDARIEVIDFSRVRVPEGELEFPLSGLRQTADGGYWSGFVRYAGGRRFLVWAKVKVRTSSARVVAAEALKPGQVLAASQLRIETRDEFSTAPPVVSIEDAVGKVLRRAVPAGAEIQQQWLAAPPDISRGDTVRVEVHSGAAVLAFEGKAEAGGSVGQSIAVLNPDSKKKFQARIEGKGRVSVRSTL